MSQQDPPDQRREGETGPLPQRGSRTFQKDDSWYFMTRERVDVGPFATQDLAEKGVQDYAGFSMDSDKVYLDSLDVVPDESGIALPEEELVVLPPDQPGGEVFDRRRGDESPAHNRSSRVFESIDGYWFSTREGGNIGPFPTRHDAERGVQDYVSFAVDSERMFDEIDHMDFDN